MNAEKIANGCLELELDCSPVDQALLARALLVAIEALEQVEAIGEPMDCADIAREALAKIRGKEK